jgi:hypothetical protein
MARNRVIYQSEGVFVGQKTPCTGDHYPADIKEIYRVQSANYSFNLNKRDVNQFGELAAIDRVVLDPPTVSLDATYLLANAYNENALGMNVAVAGTATWSNALTGILGGTTDQKCIWVKTVAYGSDLHNLNTTGASVTPFGVIGFGNGYLSSYSVDASVGDFPRASVRFDASNVKFDNFTGGGFTNYATQALVSPAISITDGTLINSKYWLPSGVSTTDATDKTTVLRPGDLVFDWASATGFMGANLADAKIQSFSMSADVARTPLNRLGTKFPFSYEINFPINATLRVSANVGDMNTGSLTALVSDTGSFDLTVKINKPGTTTVAYAAALKGAQLDSQEYSSSIGDNKSVNWSFSVPIGGVNDVTKGLFISGLL